MRLFWHFTNVSYDLVSKLYKIILGIWFVGPIAGLSPSQVLYTYISQVLNYIQQNKH